MVPQGGATEPPDDSLILVAALELGEKILTSLFVGVRGKTYVHRNKCADWVSSKDIVGNSFQLGRMQLVQVLVRLAEAPGNPKKFKKIFLNLDLRGERFV